MQMSSRTIGFVLLLAMCSCAITSHASTITVGVVNVENVEAGTYLASQTDTMVNLMQSTANLRNLLNYDYAAIEMTVTTNSPTETAQVQMNTVVDQHTLSYVEAGYPSSVTSFNQLFVDPISLTPTLLSTGGNLVFICPTVAQQLTLFAQYLGSNKPSKLAIISVVDTYSSEVLAFLVSALKKQDVPIGSVFTIEPSLSASTFMPTDGLTIILGTTGTMASDVATFIKNNQNAKVMLLFDDFTMHYDLYSSTLGTTYAASQENIFLVTNLPPWIKAAAAGALTDGTVASLPARVLTESAYSSAMSTYYADVPATSQTPAGLRAFITALVVNAAANHAGSVSSSFIRKTLLSGQTFAVGDTILGPFTTTCTAPEENCLLNNGPRGISLWTYGGLLQSGGSPLVRNSFTQTNSDFKDDYDNIFLWAILGVIAVMLLLLLILLLFCCCYPCFCCAGAGESRPSQSKMTPVTIAVVEIDDPSTLQAVDSAEMSSVCSDLHRLVEKRAKQYGCRLLSPEATRYVLECMKAENAVRFGCAVQDDVRRQRSDAVAGMYGSGEGSNGFVRSMLQVRVGIHSGQRDCAPDAGDEQEMKVETCAASTCSLGRGGGKVLLTDATHKLLPSAADKKYHIEFFGDYSVGDDDGSQSIFVIAAPVVDAHDGILDEDEEVVGQGTGGEKMSRFSAVEVSEAFQEDAGCESREYPRGGAANKLTAFSSTENVPRSSAPPMAGSDEATAQLWIAPAAASAGVLGALHAEEVGRGDGPARVVDRSAPEQRSAPMELMASEEEARAMRERNAAAESHRDARVTEAKPQPPVVEEAAQERSAPMELMATEEESRVVKDAQPQRQARAAPVVAAAPVRSGSNQKTKSAVQERAAPMEMASAEESRAVKDVQPQRQTRAAPVAAAAAAAAPIQGSGNQKTQPTVQERVQERAAPMELMASEEESRAVRNAPLREDRARETTAAPVAQSAPQTKPPLGADGGSRKPIAAAEDPSPYQTAEGMASYPPCKRCSELYGDDVVNAPKTADNEGSTGPCCPHCGYVTELELPLSKAEKVSRSTQMTARRFEEEPTAPPTKTTLLPARGLQGERRGEGVQSKSADYSQGGAGKTTSTKSAVSSPVRTKTPAKTAAKPATLSMNSQSVPSPTKAAGATSPAKRTRPSEGSPKAVPKPTTASQRVSPARSVNPSNATERNGSPLHPCSACAPSSPAKSSETPARAHDSRNASPGSVARTSASAPSYGGNRNFTKASKDLDNIMAAYTKQHDGSVAPIPLKRGQRAAPREGNPRDVRSRTPRQHLEWVAKRKPQPAPESDGDVLI